MSSRSPKLYADMAARDEEAGISEDETEASLIQTEQRTDVGLLRSESRTDIENADRMSAANYRPGPGRRWPDLITDVLWTAQANPNFNFWSDWIATFLFTGVLGHGLVKIAMSMYELMRHSTEIGMVQSMDLSRLVNDFTFFISLLLVFLLWHTMCYCSKTVKKFWQTPAVVKIIGSMMAGGFVPRPAAASMGLLMLLNHNLLHTSLLTGADFGNANDGYGIDASFDSCTANAAEFAPLLGSEPSVWFQRFHREPAEGCYLIGKVFADFEHVTNPEAEGLTHPIIDGKPVLDKWCTYRCSGFKALSISDLIQSVGVIVSGSAIIVKVADMLTGRIGWHLLTEDSDPSELVMAVLGQPMPDLASASEDELVEQMQNVYVRRPGNALFAAIQLLAVIAVSKVLTPLVTIDGYNTSDYYTMLIMMVSVLSSLMIRSWSPFQGRSVIYTKRMWEEGADDFTLFDPKTKEFDTVTINLYDWIRLPFKQRNKNLLHYCRAITMDELGDLYNHQGFVPDINEKLLQKRGRVSQEQLDDEKDGDSPFAKKVVRGLFYASRPWKLFGAKKKNSDLLDEDEEKPERFKVLTKAWTKITHHHQSVDAMGTITTKSVRVVIDHSVKGIITKLGDLPGHVWVSFNDKKRCGIRVSKHIVSFMPRHDLSGEDRIDVDEKTGFILNPPMSAEETGSTDGTWHLQVPLTSLCEGGDVWGFVRKLFGEESMKDLMKRCQ